MTYRRPNNLIELGAAVFTGLMLGAAALLIGGFVVGAIVLVVMR